MDLQKIRGQVRLAGEFPRSWPPRARAALWLAAAFAAAFLVYPAGWLYPSDNYSLSFLMDNLISHGKPLLYGLPSRLPVMPLTGVAALAGGNAGWGGAQLLWSSVSALLALSAYGLGCQLAGRAAGAAAAAAMFAGQAYGWAFFDFEQRFYCLCLTTVANALALTSGPARARRAIESCAVGLSFLARPVLCWFPALLALLELPRAAGGSLRRRLVSAGLVLAVPFLFLLPWTRFNWEASRRLALFDGRGDWNVVTGAMGVVSTFEGDYRALAGLGPDESALLWSAKRIGSHPLVYAGGVVKRCAFIFSGHPLIFCCWLAGALLLWRRPGFGRVNLLAAYFLAVHLAFSSEERYFIAVLPLMAAVAAAAVFALAAGTGPEESEGRAAAAVAALPPALAGAFCVFLLLGYRAPAAGGEREALERALSRAPRDAWLNHEYGLSRLLRGDYDGAYAGLGRAAVLSPAQAAWKTDLAAAALLKNRRFGRPAAGADLIEKLPLGSADWAQDRVGGGYVLRSLYEIDAGLPGKAAASAALARREHDGYIRFKLRSDAAPGREALARAGDTGETHVLLPELLRYFPDGQRERLRAGFLALYQGRVPAPAGAPAAGKGAPRAGGPAKKLSDAAVELIKKNDLAGAAALLAKAVESDPDNFEARMNLCYIASRTGDAGLGGEHCGEAVFLAARPPEHSLPSRDRLPSALLARGLFYLKSGDRARACRDVRRAAEAVAGGWAPARAALPDACGTK